MESNIEIVIKSDGKKVMMQCHGKNTSKEKALDAMQKAYLALVVSLLKKELTDKEKIEFNEEQYNKALPLIKAQLKALIARDLWDMNEYFQVMNATNKSVERALEILNDKEYEKILK